MYIDIYFSPIPYAPHVSSGTTLFWILFLNTIAVALASLVLFMAFNEERLLFKVKASVPYMLLAVAAGVPIDMLFLYQCSESCTIRTGPHSYFYTMLKNGSGAIFPAVFSTIIVPSVVAFLLLASLHIVAIKYVFFRKMNPWKVLSMSLLMAFAMLPTWGTLYFLTR